VSAHATPASAQAAPPAGAHQNPFFAPSTLPFHAPPFDRIHDADYRPAIEAGMKQQLAQIDSIANQAAAPTFDNTLVAMERSGTLLTRVMRAFNAVTSANTDDSLQAVQTEEAPKLAAHSDAIYLNAKLFQRVKSLYDRRESLGLDPEQLQLVKHYYDDFVRQGALLSDADKAKLRELNQQESKLSTEFINRLLAGTKAGAVVVDDSAELAGLSPADVAAAAQAAEQRGLEGKWVLPLQNTTQQPAQAYLKDRALRKRLFEASTLRTEHGDANDTRAVIRQLAKERAERAKLLGFPDYAAYSLTDEMAKTQENAIGLLTQIVKPAVAKAKSEMADMQQLIDQQGGGFKLQAWDWQYYAEQVRKAKYDLDDSQIRPYFELNTVLEDGVFYAANRLYGITFKERHDIPVYNPDVRVFEVFDADGGPLALFYCDYFKRDNKQGGAWMDNLVDQSHLLGLKPVVYNVANFTKPAPGQPALLTFDDVTTMFHEFGHALNGMFSNVEYPTLSGANTTRDFVEFPSQFNEHWASDPQVFAHYAHNYKTGAPMPAELVAKIKKTRTFNQGFATTELVEAALLDMAWHTLNADQPVQSVDSLEAASLKGFGFDIPQVPPRYRSSYFMHIWGNGYSAGYYAYLWAEVLDDDAFAWFQEHGGLTRANGQRYRDMILSRGHTEDEAQMFRAFTGHDPTIGPLLENRGLTGGGSSSGN
jgi:peptidyl-dipeptidase Dcp